MVDLLARSTSSSALSSPGILHADSTAPSYSSSLSSSLPFYVSREARGGEDRIDISLYDGVGYYGEIEDPQPIASLWTGNPGTVSLPRNSTSSNVSRPESLDSAERAEDDTAVRPQPSTHVDYLSHNWKEEDIWSSWKHVVSRRNAYSNSARLENASWRTWTKSKNGFKTVSPESVNW
jgi:hypothetical protein